MNSKVLILIAASVLFVGCSKDDNKKSDGGFEIQQDFKPNSVPADAMSEYDLADLMHDTKKINDLVPQEDSLMTTEAVGGRIDKIPTEKINKATSLLSSQGLQVLRDVKANCQITEPQGSVFSENIRVREMQSSEIKSGVSGDLKKCPLNIISSNQSQRYYTSFERQGHAAAGTFEQVFGSTQTMFVSPRLAEMSGVRTIALSMSMKANVTSSLTTGTYKGYIKGRGVYTLDYTNGERLSGPIQMESAYKNNVNTQQLLIDLKSSKGTLRIVFTVNGKEKKAYVNGKAVSYELASKAYIPHGVNIGN